jgi:putative flippase GtrA
MMFIVIPAYRPDDRLINIIDGLSFEGRRFIVVDDGSGPQYAPVFRWLEKEYSESVTVIHHSLNRGKGHALKTAFAFIKDICGETDCVLTIDADSDRFIANAEKVISAWKASPDSFVIGSRHYTDKVPIKSRIITGITHGVFNTTTGTRVHDILSGLRAFSTDYLTELIGIKGERYDYEIAELLYATKQHIPIIEVPVSTEFHSDSRSAHFRLFRDSWLIYKMIFVFMLSSFSCFVIDYSLLLILAAIFKRLPAAVEVTPGAFRMPMFGMLIDTHLIALVIARAISSFVNFLLNMKVVFKTGSKAAIVKFYIVIIGLLLANYGLLALVANADGLPLWIAQLVVQAVLYPFSFILQRKFVFPDKNRKAAGVSEVSGE